MFDIDLLKKPVNIKKQTVVSSEESQMAKLKSKRSTQPNSGENEEIIKVSKRKYVLIISVLVIIILGLLLKFDKIQLYSNDKLEVSQKETVNKIVDLLLSSSDSTYLDNISFLPKIVKIQISTDNQNKLEALNQLYFAKFNKWASVHGQGDSIYHLTAKIPWFISEDKSKAKLNSFTISEDKLMSELLRLVETGIIFENQIEIKRINLDEYAIRFHFSSSD